jgi:hypothetical protein
MMQPKYFKLLSYLILLFIFIFILCNNRPFFFDEPWYYSNVLLFQKFGYSKDFLINLKGPAGPSYAIIFFYLSFFTNNNIILIRLVNFLFLILTLMYLNKNISLYTKIDKSYIYSYSALSVPMIFLSTTFAITNNIGLFFVTFSIFLLHKSLTTNKNFTALFAGISMTIGILSRQPYLIIPLLSPFLLYNNLNFNNLKKIIIYLFSSLFLPLYVFSIWKNLIPLIGSDTISAISFMPIYGFYAFGYMFLITILIAPKFLIKLDFKIILPILILIFLCCLYFKINSVILTFYFFQLPNFLQTNLKIIISTTLIFGTFYFNYSLIYRLYYNFNNYNLFLSSIIFTILFSCIKITHQFSSLYVLQALPFFIILLSPYMEFNKKSFTLKLLGFIIGLFSLISYHYY